MLLVTARRDAYVAGFQLLNAMGMAEAEDLNLDGGPLYDPTVNYRPLCAQLVRLERRAAAAAGRHPHGAGGFEQPDHAGAKQVRDRAAKIGDKILIMGDIQQDPSMEEILASIKRVIAEDNRTAATVAPRAARRIARAEPPADDDVLELDDPVSEGSGLLSDDAASASRERLATLSALRQRNDLPPEAGALEAVVRDMLRPMLKDWLDQHLPEIVEDLVSREVARITGRDI